MVKSQSLIKWVNDMGNLHLVTGHKGQGHVTAADHGSLYAAIFGGDSYVLNRGNKLAATVVSNNSITIADGDIVLQGRHIRLNEGNTVALTIENGAQGVKRNDLIVVRYTRDAASGVEDANLVVIKGKAVTATPSDPEYTDGDIINDHAETVDFPLYRVPLDGLTVGTLEQLFEVVGIAKTDSTGKMNADQLPPMDYIKTSEKGAANGVAELDGSGLLPVGKMGYTYGNLTITIPSVTGSLVSNRSKWYRVGKLVFLAIDFTGHCNNKVATYAKNFTLSGHPKQYTGGGTYYAPYLHIAHGVGVLNTLESVGSGVIRANAENYGAANISMTLDFVTEPTTDADIDYTVTGSIVYFVM